MMWFGNYGWGFGWLWMIFVWVLLIVGLAALIKWLIDSSGRRNGSSSALEILKERYARGEIAKKEFDEKKKDLV